MVEFAYNNSKNESTSHILFKLNCGYHPCVSFKNKYDARSRSFSAKGLAMELKELINICCQHFLHAQNLQKQAYDKEMKPQSYAIGEKVWLSNKYIKTKKNRKLEAKFFGFFQIFYPVEK